VIEIIQGPFIRRLETQQLQHLPRQIRRRRPTRRTNRYTQRPRILQDLRDVLVESEALTPSERHSSPIVSIDRGLRKSYDVECWQTYRSTALEWLSFTFRGGVTCVSTQNGHSV